MREVISLHVGQAGIQIGNACCKSSLSDQAFVALGALRDNAVLIALKSRMILMYCLILWRIGELYTVEHGLNVCTCIILSLVLLQSATVVANRQSDAALAFPSLICAFSLRLMQIIF